MANTDSHVYPISKVTFEKYIDDFFSAVKVDECLCFKFGEKVGGSRAWIKFIVNNPGLTTFNKISSDISKFVIFEPSECLEQSNLAFFYLLLSKLSNKKIKSYEHYSLEKIIKEISKIISQTDKKIVIFIIKLDEFNNLNPTLGNLLYSLWRDNKEKLTFITTLSKTKDINSLSEKIGLFRECLLTKFIDIEKVADKDIEQSIEHWDNILKANFSQKERSAIRRFSEGKLEVSKILCQEVAKKQYGKDILGFCQKTVERLTNTEKQDELLIGGENTIFVGSKNITNTFNYNEHNVLKLLIQNNNKVVNRDEIADTLWKDDLLNKYSDWTIDKYISLIRKKLSNTTFRGQIKTRKGEGFVLIQ